jgi:acyl carrier protein
MTRATDELTGVVTGIWESVLGVEDIGGEENFLDLGGDSMTATEVAMRLRERLGLDVPLRMIFDHPTVEELAAALQARLS